MGVVVASQEPGAVLVVDDSAVARALVARKLAASGVSVDAVATVSEGKARAQGTVPCALLDLELDDGTGIDVARALRAASPSCPLAFFTSEPTGALAEEARAFGPVFTKPADIDLAVRWVMDALGRL